MSSHDQLNEELLVLLNLYISREDLKRAFPETVEGDMDRLIHWVTQYGLSIDSSKETLIPFEHRYKNCNKGYMMGLKESIKKYLSNKKGNLWDNSSEHYINNNFKIYWETLFLVAHYQFESVSGNPNLDLFNHTIQLIKDYPPFNGKKIRCAIIGCSEITRPELALFNSGLFEEITVFDIAQGLLKKQQLLAEQDGYKHIFYKVADMNVFEFSRNSLDFIFGWGTVHHIEKLEHFFAQARKALTKDGLIILREYVGPNYIQLTEKQMQLTDALLALIPDEYKKTPAGAIKIRGDFPNIEELIKVDPSESVRSQDILDALKTEFDMITFCKTGGTILHPLLSNIAGNFEKDERGSEILKQMIKIEKALIDGDLIPSDYVYLVARRKDD